MRSSRFPGDHANTRDIGRSRLSFPLGMYLLFVLHCCIWWNRISSFPECESDEHRFNPCALWWLWICFLYRLTTNRSDESSFCIDIVCEQDFPTTLISRTIALVVDQVESLCKWIVLLIDGDDSKILTQASNELTIVDIVYHLSVHCLFDSHHFMYWWCNIRLIGEHEIEICTHWKRSYSVRTPFPVTWWQPMVW